MRHADRLHQHPPMHQSAGSADHRVVIPLSESKETNVVFGAFRKMRFAERVSAGRFLDKSAFLLSHGARTTPSSSLDFSRNHSSISLFSNSKWY